MPIKRDVRVPGEDGNTTPPSRTKQPIQLIKWFFTYNNYDEKEIEILETRFQEICVKYVFQQERGTSGTPHLQGSIWLKKKMRPSEFALAKQIHWEKMRNEPASIAYCQKSETSVEGASPHIWGFPKPIKTIETLRPWQSDLIEEIGKEPDGRRLLWIYEGIGKVGKSTFCKYLYLKHNAIVIQGGKLADIMNIIFNTDMNEERAVVLDIPRVNRNKVSYASIECILNGMITNTKYETGIKCFNPPHVIVFSNYKPDYDNDEHLSRDRWDVRMIKDDHLIEQKLYFT